LVRPSSAWQFWNMCLFRWILCIFCRVTELVITKRKINDSGMVSKKRKYIYIYKGKCTYI
jgi:hypothetical protein